MSLINEALKKAQRLRAEDQAGDAPPLPGGGRIAKRGQARSSQTIVLLASGAIVLVVLSVVVTFWLANRPSSSPTPAVTSAPPANKGPTVEPAPLVVPPVITPAPIKSATDAPTTTAASNSATGSAEIKPSPAPTKSPATAATQTPPPTPAASGPVAPSPMPATKPPGPAVATSTPSPTTPSPAAASPATTAPTPIATSPSATTAAATATPTVSPSVEKAPPGPAKPDERVAAFVEAVRVTAIRANDNKVMMNDRMYRVNDIVERNLGVKLIKVAADSLTFADSNGVTYVKFF